MKKIIFILAILMMVLAACVDSGDYPCATGVRLQLTYAERPDQPLILIEDIDRLDIFVYDAQGTYVTRIPFSDMQQLDAWTLYFDLPAGDYNFTLWTGAKEQFYTISGIEPGVSNVNDGRLKLNRNENNVVPEPPSQLRYNRRNGITIAEENELSLKIPMQRYTSNIRILMRGLPNDGAGHSFDIKDNNGIARMSDLAFMPDDEITYIPRPTSLTRAETLAGIFTVMRLAQGRHPVLTLYEGSQVRQQWDLIDELLGKYPEAGFSRGNDYEIIFSFREGSYIAFSITINGWEIIDEIID